MNKTSVKAVFLSNILLGDFVDGPVCAWLQPSFIVVREEPLGTLLQLRLCTVAVEAYHCTPLTARSFCIWYCAALMALICSKEHTLCNSVIA